MVTLAQRASKTAVLFMNLSPNVSQKILDILIDESSIFDEIDKTAFMEHIILDICSAHILASCAIRGTLQLQSFSRFVGLLEKLLEIKGSR